MTAEIYGANTPIVPDETVEKWLGKETPVKKMTKKEFIQKQIEELQTALKLLEIEENRKSPCEKAYQDAYGKFPVTDSMSGGDKDYIAWAAFQKGWEARKDYHVNDIEENEMVAENFKTYLPYNQDTGTLKDLIRKWEFEFSALWEKPENRTCELYDKELERFIHMFKEWLPKEQSANSQNVWVECTVEGFNDCLQEIKSKLR